MKPLSSNSVQLWPLICLSCCVAGKQFCAVAALIIMSFATDIALTAIKLPPEAVIFGRSEAMRVVRENIERIAPTNLPVLVQGESGTGKEVIARLIHNRSPREASPFVKVSCPTVSAAEFESEFLACELPGKSARIQRTRRGTLFLDEVGELDVILQPKLLQFLQAGPFCGSGPQQVAARDRVPQQSQSDAASCLTVAPPTTASFSSGDGVGLRLICATSRNLTQEIEAGNFRQDLLYRINVLNIALPPLRERREDVPELAAYFLDLYNESFGCRVRPFSSRLMELLLDYHWPGNVRELENLVKRYVILGSEDAITCDLLNRAPDPALPGTLPLDGSVPLKKVTRQATRQIERLVILNSLQANNWNRKRVARALHISYRALLYKIRDAGITSARSRTTEGDAATDVKAA
jgi:two-component system, NtrC family, response regulator AtoC